MTFRALLCRACQHVGHRLAHLLPGIALSMAHPNDPPYDSPYASPDVPGPMMTQPITRPYAWTSFFGGGGGGLARCHVGHRRAHHRPVKQCGRNFDIMLDHFSRLRQLYTGCTYHPSPAMFDMVDILHRVL